MKYIYNIKNNDLSFNNFHIQISIEKNVSQIRIILGTDPDFFLSESSIRIVIGLFFKGGIHSEDLFISNPICFVF